MIMDQLDDGQKWKWNWFRGVKGKLVDYLAVKTKLICRWKKECVWRDAYIQRASPPIRSEHLYQEMCCVSGVGCLNLSGRRQSSSARHQFSPTAASWKHSCPRADPRAPGHSGTARWLLLYPPPSTTDLAYSNIDDKITWSDMNIARRRLYNLLPPGRVPMATKTGLAVSLPNIRLYIIWFLLFWS